MRYGELKIKIHTSDKYMIRCEDMLVGYTGPREVALDLGAHVGTRSLWLATDGGFKKIYAVEPSIYNMHLLCENIRTNNLHDQIIPVLAAVDIRSDLKDFKYCGINKGQCSISYRKDIFTNGYKVVSIPLAQLIAFIENPVDFVKMDIEGGEYSIFSNVDCAYAALINVKCIFIETHGPNKDFFNTGWFERLGYDPEKPNARLMANIRACGFINIKLTAIKQIMGRR